jgi:hypothetical protein
MDVFEIVVVIRDNYRHIGSGIVSYAVPRLLIIGWNKQNRVYIL